MGFKVDFESRTRAMSALGRSVNLFLAVKIAAHNGNDQLAEMVREIEARVPASYSHVKDEAPFQAFYIGQTFIILISEFEGFLVDVMKEIIKRHPKKLGQETFRLSEILDLQDVDAVIDLAAERFLNGLMYKKAADYRRALVDLLSASDDFLADKWPQYIECKARRDIGVHNDWRVNETYNRKTAEAGLPPKPLGYASPSNEYFWQTISLLTSLASDIYLHCVDKFPGDAA